MTEVVDSRSAKRESRYMSRQIRADNGQPSDVTVIVADSAITLLPGSNQPQGAVAGTAQPTAVVDGAGGDPDGRPERAVPADEPHGNGAGWAGVPKLCGGGARSGEGCGGGRAGGRG